MLGQKGRQHSSVVNHDYSGRFAIRKGKWKLVPGKVDKLFDLEQDPKESKDVAASHSDLVAEMKKILAAYKEDGRSVSR